MGLTLLTERYADRIVIFGTLPNGGFAGGMTG